MGSCGNRRFTQRSSKAKTPQRMFGSRFSMPSPDEIYDEYIGNYLDSLRYLTNFQKESGLQVIRKEGEVLLLIKLEPGQPVKYYMNKSGMSSRWFNEILKHLLASKLVVQETCPYDSRRKLLS
jgi:hypothetical protein